MHRFSICFVDYKESAIPVLPIMAIVPNLTTRQRPIWHWLISVNGKRVWRLSTKFVAHQMWKCPNGRLYCDELNSDADGTNVARARVASHESLIDATALCYHTDEMKASLLIQNDCQIDAHRMTMTIHRGNWRCVQVHALSVVLTARQIQQHTTNVLECPL